MQRPQEQRRGEQDADQGQCGGHRRRSQTAGEDLELGDESGEPGQTERAERGHGRQRREPGRRGGQTSVGGHVVGSGPRVQDPGEQEQGTGEQAVADHLRHRAGDRHRGRVRLGPGGQPGRAQSQQDVAHVVDGGVGDHPLEVGLGQRDQCSVQHRDHSQGHEHRGVGAPRLGQDRHGDADEAVGAHLQQHPGQDRRTGRGRVGVGGRQPGVERHQGGLDRQTEGHGQQHQAPGRAPAVQRGLAGQLHHVEGARVGGQVQADEAQQQRQRPDERVQEELQRRARGGAVAPSGDDEVHADDRQVEEDEEQDQVERDEQAQRHRLQEQEQRGLTAHPLRPPQRVHRAGAEQDRRHRHQRQGQAVHPDVVAGADAGDPAQVRLVGDRSGRTDRG